MRLRHSPLLFLVLGCAPAQYAFIAPALVIDNPNGAELPDKEATAMDGLTKHRWKTFTSTEACFESRLNDLQVTDVDARRPFLLLAFRDRTQPLDHVPSIKSSNALVVASGKDSVKTEETAIPLYHVDLEICFPNPQSIILPSTEYVVLRVPYSTDDSSVGAGTRDGVWKLQPK